jgi:hypothetical protein
MSNIVSIVGGGIAIIIGLLGLIFWWDSLITILKGGIPILLLLGGIISLMVGISEIKESSKPQGGQKKT